MTLYLVRHGQSTWNVAGRVQGQTMHPPLTGLGREQAASAAVLLAALPIARVISSDQVRATQTAEIIGDTVGVRPTFSSLLREQDLGDWHGLTTGQAMEAWQRHFGDDGWENDGRATAGRPPGGESLADVSARVAALCASPLVADADGDVVLVSHGDTIRVMIAHLLGEELESMPWREIGNGAVYRVDRCGTESTPVAELLPWVPEPAR